MGDQSRRAEFGNGASFMIRDIGGEHVHSAIRAAGGDPARYSGKNWDEESIRTVEEDRRRSQSDWDD